MLDNGYKTFVIYGNVRKEYKLHSTEILSSVKT